MRCCSTRESIEKGEVSLLAIVETLLAVALLVTLSLWLNTIQWLAGAVCIAPLLLLRTEDSVLRGQRWNKVLDRADEKWIALLIGVIGVALIALVIWKSGWWSVPIILFLGGALLAFMISPVFLCIRVGATAVSIVLHPLQSFAAIPGNWRRIVLATDTATPPEFLPGDDAGPMVFLSDWHRLNAFLRWYAATLFLGSYPLTAAYRWSVKATCLIYLPLIWLVETARFSTESVQVALDDYQDSIWRRFLLSVSALVIVGVGVKWMLVLSLTGFAQWWDGNAALRFMKLYVMPHEMPLWQLASGANSVLAFFLWGYARTVARQAAKNRAPAETTVRAVWRTGRAVSVLLSLYTITCTVLITWHAGRLAENLHRLWDSIGKRVLP